MKIEQLKVRRAKAKEDILMVPEKLLCQIGGLEKHTVDAVYENAEVLATTPNIWFLLLLNHTKEIKGVLWFTVDIFERQLFVYLFSVDPEYQSCDLNHARWVGEFLFGLTQIPADYRRKIQWLTNRPKLYERFGVKRSRRVLLEISREDYVESLGKLEADSCSV